MDGVATSAFVRPRGCSPIWKRGSAEDCVCIFGGSGRTGTIASRSCVVEALPSSLPRLLPVRQRDSGACQDTRRFKRRCAITSSLLSACLAYTLRVEAQPGRTAEVRTRMPGGVGGAAPRGSPLSRSLAPGRRSRRRNNFVRYPKGTTDAPNASMRCPHMTQSTIGSVQCSKGPSPSLLRHPRSGVLRRRIGGMS